jgi:hypothetical protein
MNPHRAHENAFTAEKVCGFGTTGIDLACVDASDWFLSGGVFSEDRAFFGHLAEP